MFELDRKGCAVRVIVGQQPPAHAGTWPESTTACMMKVSSFIQSRLDTVVRDSDVAIISRRDAGGNAVVMSLDHYNSLMETLHLYRPPPTPPPWRARSVKIKRARPSRRPRSAWAAIDPVLPGLAM
ncbi:MAG: hypothetical protein WBM15_02260 [Chromatiaceae bacterium]